MKTLLLAGGCFWCIAAPYYNLEGVEKVISGYCGGEEVSPTYEEVKHQHTHHRETICIVYDENKVSYKKLIEMYFENIDPFDEGGQFMDRGRSYSCAIFSDDEKIKLYAESIALAYEEHGKRKVYVPVFPESKFYPAEDEHQEYALKHPELFQKELKQSGRK